MTSQSPVNKSTQPFGKRQIFTLKKRDTLSKRLEAYLLETKYSARFIQFCVAIMIRNAFSPLDLSFVAKEHVRDLFLNGEAPASVRHLCLYFQDYFTTEKEWQTVISHLYKNQQEFNQLTQETRLHIESLRPALISGEQPVDRKRKLKAAFLDEAGKMHNWSLSNVVCLRSPQEHLALLNILGELTIFQKEGVRQFTQVVWLDFAIDERSRNFDIRNEEDPMYQAKESVQEQPEKTPAKKQSIKTSMPKDVAKENSQAAQSTTSANQSQQTQHSILSEKKKLGKPPTDRMPSWKNLNAVGKIPKEEKDLELEKAVRKKTGKKKNRKRNKRK
ncbi:hypothetical protein [Enterococcus sp. AZ163]|uniref:hypothetical protein n=1 Tax=Enterococcus sp. AZ163 TaxID=2774638 RepID=UPI003D2ADB20